MKRYRGIEFLFDSVLSGFNCLIIAVLFIVGGAFLFAFPVHTVLFIVLFWLAMRVVFPKPKQPEEKGKAFKDGTPEEIAEREERAKRPLNR